MRWDTANLFWHDVPGPNKSKKAYSTIVSDMVSGRSDISPSYIHRTDIFTALLKIYDPDRFDYVEPYIPTSNPKRLPKDRVFTTMEEVFDELGIYVSPNSSWVCPACKRAPYDTAFISSNGTWFASFVTHHDHGEYRQSSYMPKRFPDTVICGQCNTFEGALIRRLGLTGQFSFSPSELATILAGKVAKNEAHSGRAGEFLDIARIIHKTIEDHQTVAVPIVQHLHELIAYLHSISEKNPPLRRAMITQQALEEFDQYVSALSRLDG